MPRAEATMEAVRWDMWQHMTAHIAEVCVSVKSDLLTWKKSPTYLAKEPYLPGKIALLC